MNYQKKENTMEKVIREFRVIETDDGYRIEIKGDKERLKHFIHGFGFGGGMGGRKWRKRYRKHRAGPFGFGPMGWMQWFGGPGDFTAEDEPEEKESED
jgi:hypothetical protein